MEFEARRRVVAVIPRIGGARVRIDLGSRDGVVTNCPVLNVDGLVGRVSEVGLPIRRSCSWAIRIAASRC